MVGIDAAHAAEVVLGDEGVELVEPQWQLSRCWGLMTVSPTRWMPISISPVSDYGIFGKAGPGQVTSPPPSPSPPSGTHRSRAPANSSILVETKAPDFSGHGTELQRTPGHAKCLICLTLLELAQSGGPETSTVSA